MAGTQPAKGVRIIPRKDSKSISISFMFEGEQRREIAPGLDGDKKGDIKIANGMKSEIDKAIIASTFKYADYFPNSAYLKKLAAKKPLKLVKPKDKTNIYDPEQYNPLTIAFYLAMHLKYCIARGLAASTIKGYKTNFNQCKPFHHMLVTELKQSHLKEFVIDTSLQLKSIRNMFGFMLPAINEAVIDDVITHNPCLGFKPSQYIKKKTKTDLDGRNTDVQPFTPKEIELILTNCEFEQDKNLFQFAFETGLRSSELCALRWSNYDPKTKSIRVAEAFVLKQTKQPKTNKGFRQVELSQEAIKALEAQREHTQLKGGVIFHNPRTNQQWQGDAPIRKRAWQPTLERAGVKYRYPYQARHTYATMQISRGANLWWLADQMGHNGPEMLFRHYGFYIRQHDPEAEKRFNIK